MRILHVLDHSLPLHSGYSFRTVSILREQRALGWETFHVTTPRHGPSAAATEEVDGWTFHRTAPQGGWLDKLPVAGTYLNEMALTAARVGELVRRLKPDILHAHSPVLTALPALHVARQFDLPVIYEVRALWEDGAVDHGTTREGSLRYKLTRALETFALRRATRVTTICEGLRAEIVERGVDASRVTVIPNAVDTDQFVFDPQPDAALRRRLKLDGKAVLGFIGSFYGYEGLELLVDAFAGLSRRRSDIHLLLAGGGPAEGALREQVARLGIADRVTLAGRIPHEDVWRYYSVMDLMIYPRLPTRLTHLVTPMKPLEAMAQGRLVLASDVGGHRELIRDGENAFLFTAGDAPSLARSIEKILDEGSQWETIRARARQFVEAERTWKASVSHYRQAYA